MASVQDFDSSVNLLQAILWQYEDAEKLLSIARAKQAWIENNQTEFWSSWYRDVFNIETANAFGLSVWGRILNIKMQVIEAPQPSKVPFGFGSFNANFNNGNFGVLSDQSIGLTLEQQRTIVRMRYFQLTSRCTTPEINEFLKGLFGDQGTVYVIDSYDMSFVTFLFTFTPDSHLQFILENYDLLPRPAAVGAQWVVQREPAFGFGPYNLNFTNGQFGA